MLPEIHKTWTEIDFFELNCYYFPMHHVGAHKRLSKLVQLLWWALF